MYSVLQIKCETKNKSKLFDKDPTLKKSKYCSVTKIQISEMDTGQNRFSYLTRL